MTERLAGKVVIVTGAARGIGAAIAAQSARLGAKVVLTDINAAGEGIAAGLRSQGGSAEFRSLDVRSAAAWQALADDTRQRFGRIDGTRPCKPSTARWKCRKRNRTTAWMSICAASGKAVAPCCRR